MFTKSGFVPRNKPLCLKRQNQLLFGHWPNDFHSSLKHKQEFNLATHWWLLSSTCRCRENILLPVATGAACAAVPRWEGTMQAASLHCTSLTCIWKPLHPGESAGLQSWEGQRAWAPPTSIKARGKSHPSIVSHCTSLLCNPQAFQCDSTPATPTATQWKTDLRLHNHLDSAVSCDLCKCFLS